MPIFLCELTTKKIFLFCEKHKGKTCMTAGLKDKQRLKNASYLGSGSLLEKLLW
jgi:hypothetical protein